MAIPIRCTNPKKHSLYSECGSLLCAIDGEEIYLHCPSCPHKVGSWFKLFRDETGGLTIKKMPINFTLNLVDELKVVE